MKSAGTAAMLLLLTAFLAGCRHRAKATPPTQAQAPSLPVSTLADNAPLPDVPPPQLPRINAPEPKTVAREQKPKPHKAVHHKPRHTTIEPTPAETPTPAQTPVEQAATDIPTDVSPIGRLSAAGDSTNLPRRNHILEEIQSTQKGLDDVLKRPLTKDEQTTVTQIKTFLEKAKIALNAADLDGAHTLITKAKVLLDELTKS